MQTLNATTRKPQSALVNDDGELLVSGAGGGGGGGGDASAANQDEQTALLTTIDASVDEVEDKLDTVIAALATLDGHVDGLESSLSSVDTKLTQLGKSGGREYETVAASQTDQVLGPTGATGDYLECLVCVVSTAATSQVQIKDGSGSAITVLPNAVGAGVGTYHVALGLTSTSGAWKVTTAAGVSVIASGDFT